MQKTITCTLSDFKGYYLEGDRYESLMTALRGERAKEPYLLSTAGGIRNEGCTGETQPVTFENSELLLRFQHANLSAQKGFIEGVHNLLVREKIEIVYIEVEWTPEGKKKTISATLNKQKFTFNLV